MSCQDHETAIPLHKSSSKSPSTSPPTTTKNAPTNSCNPAPCKTKDYAATIPEGKNLAEWLEISKILDSWIEIMGGEWSGDEGKYDEDRNDGKAEDDDEKDIHRKKNKTIGKSREMKNGERDEEVADNKEEIEEKAKGRSNRDEDRDKRDYRDSRRYPKTRSRRAGDNRRMGGVSSTKDDRTGQHRNRQTSRGKSIRQLAEYTKDAAGKRESRYRGISSGGNFKLESDIRSSETYRSPTITESCQRRGKTNFEFEAMPFLESRSHGDEENPRQTFSAKEYRPLKDLQKSQNYALQTRTEYLPRNITPEKTDPIKKSIEIHRPPEQYRRKKHEISLEKVPARRSSIEPRTPPVTRTGIDLTSHESMNSKNEKTDSGQKSKYPKRPRTSPSVRPEKPNDSSLARISKRSESQRRIKQTQLMKSHCGQKNTVRYVTDYSGPMASNIASCTHTNIACQATSQPIGLQESRDKTLPAKEGHYDHGEGFQSSRTKEKPYSEAKVSLTRTGTTTPDITAQLELLEERPICKDNVRGKRKDSGRSPVKESFSRDTESNHPFERSRIENTASSSITECQLTAAFEGTIKGFPEEPHDQVRVRSAATVISASATKSRQIYPSHIKDSPTQSAISTSQIPGTPEYAATTNNTLGHRLKSIEEFQKNTADHSAVAADITGKQTPKKGRVCGLHDIPCSCEFYSIHHSVMSKKAAKAMNIPLPDQQSCAKLPHTLTVGVDANGKGPEAWENTENDILAAPLELNEVHPTKILPTDSENKQPIMPKYYRDLYVPPALSLYEIHPMFRNDTRKKTEESDEQFIEYLDTENSHSEDSKYRGSDTDGSNFDRIKRDDLDDKDNNPSTPHSRSPANPPPHEPLPPLPPVSSKTHDYSSSPTAAHLACNNIRRPSKLRRVRAIANLRSISSKNHKPTLPSSQQGVSSIKRDTESTYYTVEVPVRGSSLGKTAVTRKDKGTHRRAYSTPHRHHGFRERLMSIPHVKCFSLSAKVPRNPLPVETPEPSFSVRHLHHPSMLAAGIGSLPVTTAPNAYHPTSPAAHINSEPHTYQHTKKIPTTLLNPDFEDSSDRFYCKVLDTYLPFPTEVPDDVERQRPGTREMITNQAKRFVGMLRKKNRGIRKSIIGIPMGGDEVLNKWRQSVLERRG